ncbi:serine carboxypeptidase-like [Raphidocelis subcapitata]|uniref:Carboxypeptidase n=1 Tax=Raphidocelis subcapitata TaxID=307507 RepID=A0A2V0NWA5_9CHLO|nr:serine carboxypeptidase-like [Raphidocelis subcapitata]|eukprot:GBF91928.1 serine carboxypeptidase-like [Raphidocelis subcapitata]
MSTTSILLLLAIAAAASAAGRAPAAAAAADAAPPPPPPRRGAAPDLLRPTSSGYLTASRANGAELFYVFFEAEEPEGPMEETPIVLWLQGGPGCSSMFGMLYLNGPVFVQPDMSLKPNPGRWNRQYATLYVDQPIGTGYSLLGNAPIPRDELTVGAHLYTALQEFYRSHESYRKRPLYLTGESYAGKYVPSAAHFILQAHATAHGYADKLKKRREMDPDIEAPLFPLGGLAIGNGFTDAVAQTRVQAEVAWGMGLIDTRQRREAEAMQEQVIEMVNNKQWRKARDLSDQLLAYITAAAALGTLEDVRRDEGYDAPDITTRYLNLPEVKADLGAKADITYVSCSPEVDAAMGHDVMKSTANLVPDLLAFSHVLLYHGQFDAECGVGSNEAWISQLAWPGHTGFVNADRAIWRDGDGGDGEALGYWKSHSRLTHVVIRNAGHMVPHDRPEVSQKMLETWLDSTLKGPKRMEAAAAAAAAAAAPAPAGRVSGGEGLLGGGGGGGAQSFAAS